MGSRNLGGNGEGGRGGSLGSDSKEKRNGLNRFREVWIGFRGRTDETEIHGVYTWSGLDNEANRVV